MKKGVVCPNCGQVSRGIRLFCGRCGARMPKTNHVVPSTPLKINTGYRTFRNVLLLFFIIICLLMLWRKSPQGHTGTLTDADVFEEKMDVVELALRSRKSISEQISEQEINAYLAEAVRHSRGELEPIPTRLTVRDVNVHITPERVILLLRADWGPMCLSYCLTGQPVQNGTVVSFEVKQVKLGHLPIPFFLRQHMTRRVCSIFQNLSRIEKIMSNVSDLQIGDGTMKLTFSRP